MQYNVKSNYFPPTNSVRKFRVVYNIGKKVALEMGFPTVFKALTSDKKDEFEERYKKAVEVMFG